MGKLYVFGCSFSTVFNEKSLFNSDMKKYYDLRGGNFPLTWSEILSEDLGLELVNTAQNGFDNYSIFENFCKLSDKITSEDIVIIGWSHVFRFRLYSKSKNQLRSVNVWQTNKNIDLSEISQQTLDEILVNRDNKLWIDEVYNWMKVINHLSKLVKFKLYYWSFFVEFPEFYIINELLDLGAKYISHETNGEVRDTHFGEKGHKVQAEYFKNIILEKKKPKLI
jgi:hypothetical protein